MPTWLSAIINGLSTVTKIYDEAKPLADDIVAFVKARHPEHIARIDEMWPTVTPTASQQTDLEDAVRRVEAVQYEKRHANEHTADGDEEPATIDPK